MSKAIITAKDVTVQIQDHTILNRVSFTIERGDIAAIIGPNGSGKTTLIRTILGLIPFEGEIMVLGQRVGKNASLIKRFGYVPQAFQFDRSIPMTVDEFIRLGFGNMSRDRIAFVLKEVDMMQHERSQMGFLSGGELQRVLIARALVHDPTILILDEATAAVDVGSKKNLYEMIFHLNEVHKMTVLLISHEINMVYQFASKIICLNRDLICFGKPKDTITKEVLKQLYGEEVRFQAHDH